MVIGIISWSHCTLPSLFILLFIVISILSLISSRDHVAPSCISLLHPVTVHACIQTKLTSLLVCDRLTYWHGNLYCSRLRFMIWIIRGKMDNSKSNLMVILIIWDFWRIIEDLMQKKSINIFWEYLRIIYRMMMWSWYYWKLIEKIDQNIFVISYWGYFIGL